MDEIEKRLAGVEEAIIQVFSRLAPEQLLAAQQAISGTIEGTVDGDDEDIKRQALTLIEDAIDLQG